jgi:hypothetical protein
MCAKLWRNPIIYIILGNSMPMTVYLFIGPDSWVEPAMKPIVQFSFLLTSKRGFRGSPRRVWHHKRNDIQIFRLGTIQSAGARRLFPIPVCSLKVRGITACLTPLRLDVVTRQSCCFFVFDY